MLEDDIFMSFDELSSSSLMEVNQEEIPKMQNLFPSEEDEAETSLGKRKLNSLVEIEDEREVKRITFFSQEPLEEEEDIDMLEEDAERDCHSDNVLEQEYVVDFGGFF